MKNNRKGTDLVQLIKIMRITEEVVKGKYKIRYRHSRTTDSFYLDLVTADDVVYNMRFSDHRAKDKRVKTFYLNNKKNKRKHRRIKSRLG